RGDLAVAAQPLQSGKAFNANELVQSISRIYGHSVKTISLPDFRKSLSVLEKRRMGDEKRRIDQLHALAQINFTKEQYPVSWSLDSEGVLTITSDKKRSESRMEGSARNIISFNIDNGVRDTPRVPVVLNKEEIFQKWANPALRQEVFANLYLAIDEE